MSHPMIEWKNDRQLEAGTNLQSGVGWCEKPEVVKQCSTKPVANLKMQNVSDKASWLCSMPTQIGIIYTGARLNGNHVTR